MYSPMLQRHIALARVPLGPDEAGLDASSSSCRSTTATSTSTRPSPGCRSTTPNGGPPDAEDDAPPARKTADEARGNGGAGELNRAADRRSDRRTTRSSSAAATTGWSTAPTWRRPGLKTLILERRHLVGGAAITEELRPGLLVHDVLVRAQPAPARHHPRPRADQARLHAAPDALDVRADGERRLPAARPGPRREPPRDRAPQRARRRRLRRVQPRRPARSARRSSRCSTRSRPTSSATTPRSSSALAAMGSRFRKLDKKVLHDAVRLLTGSAADFLDDYFESEIIKGYLASSSIIGTKVGPYSQGSGLVLLYHILGEHDGEFGAWAFHKGGNGGFTKVLARAAQAFGAEIALESPVDRGDHQGRPGDRRRPRRRHGAPGPGRRLRRSTRAGPSSSWSIRASCRPSSSTRSSGSGSRARRRRSTSPSTARRATRPSATGPTSTAASRTSARRWSTSSGPTTTRSTAGTSKRPYIDSAIQSTIDPDMAPPGKHVMSASSSTRRTT